MSRQGEPTLFRRAVGCILQLEGRVTSLSVRWWESRGSPTPCEGATREAAWARNGTARRRFPCYIPEFRCVPKQASAWIKKLRADPARDRPETFLKGCWGWGRSVGDTDAACCFLKDKTPNVTCCGLLCMSFQSVKTQTVFHG